MKATVSKSTRHLHVGSSQGQRFRVMTDTVQVKLEATQTNGAYTLYEIRSPSGSGPAALHTHPPQETFFVLEGTYEFYGVDERGEYALRAHPGDVVHIPAGAPHGFKNVGKESGRVLALYEPPGEMQAFFEAMHAAVHHPHPLEAPLSALPDEHTALEIHQRHALEFLP
jgi:quercetin dioxygenase-like cupin family protein